MQLKLTLTLLVLLLIPLQVLSKPINTAPWLDSSRLYADIDTLFAGAVAPMDTINFPSYSSNTLGLQTRCQHLDNRHSTECGSNTTKIKKASQYDEDQGWSLWQWVAFLVLLWICWPLVRLLAYVIRAALLFVIVVCLVIFLLG